MLFDSYTDTGVFVAVDLANRLVIRPDDRPPLTVLAHILAADPSSVQQLRDLHVPEFLHLAQNLLAVFVDLDARHEDDAAARLNTLLAVHPAHPHLAKEGGRWRMHHHPGDAPLVPMWSSICAEALGRLVAAGHGDRVGVCADARCGRAFVDSSRNGSRRFCSTTCQNRAKTAALRRRRRDAG